MPIVRLSPRSPLQRRGLVALLLLLMSTLLVTSALDESPTADEPLHLTRGLAYFWGKDISLSIAHPPLGNAFAALPIVLTEPALPLESYDGYAQAEPRTVSKTIWREKYYEHRRNWFFYARMMVAALTVGMALHVYCVCRSLFGSGAALLTLFFIATHPTLIAHGRLVTTDMPVTVMCVLSLGELLRFLRGGSRWHGAFAILFTATAPLVKYSGVLQIAIVCVLIFGAAAARLGRYGCVTRRRALGAALALVATLGATSLLLTNAAYRFERTGWSAQQILAEREPKNGRRVDHSSARLDRHSFVAHVPSWVRIPLPYTFLFGIATLREHVAFGHETTFFGRPMKKGHPAYFPVLLLVKTPTLQLFGLLCAAIMVLRRPDRVRAVAWALAFYVSCFLLAAMRGSINIGVRHVLPVIPVLALLAGLGVARFLQARTTPLSRPARAAGLLAVTAHLLGLLWTFPDYISDFNALVLGRTYGERISIVGEDWDQDILRLGRLAEQHGIHKLYFNSPPVTTKQELALRGVKMVYYHCSKHFPHDAYIGVNARTLARDRRHCWDRITRYELVLKVDEHIFVYHTPKR